MFRFLSFESSVAVWCIWVCVWPLSADDNLRRQPSNDSSEIAVAVLARANAVFSGEFEYHYESGENDAKSMDISFAFALQGDSWMLRRADVPGIRLNHAGCLLEYTEVRQPTGGPRTSASVFVSEPLSDQMAIPVLRAGTLWIPGTCEFIKTHKAEGVFMGNRVTNGLPVEVYDWKVLKDDLKAFEILTPPLLEGGILRLHVSRDLDYALPLIEYISIDDDTQMSFAAHDFHEAHSGLYLPSEISFEAKNGGYRRFRNIVANRVNQAISENVFMIDVPNGTIVADNRGDSSLIVSVGAVQLDPVLQNLDGVIRQPPPPAINIRLVLIALNINIVLAVVATLAYRRYRQPKSVKSIR